MYKKKISSVLAMLLAATVTVTSCGGTETGTTAASSGTDVQTETSTRETESQKEASAQVLEIAPAKKGTIYEDTKAYTAEQIEAQKAFDEYLNDTFVESITQNTFDLHFMILHPEEMGIERTEATWGDMDADVVFEEDTSSQEELDHLHEFNYNSLNYEQQLAYDVVERTLEENIEQAKDIWFYEYFSPLSGVQTQIPILFSEYAFAEKQDVEDCLTLLEESGAYMDCLLEVEQRRAEKGYFMSDASVDTVVEQCEDFLSGDENCILTVLRDNIQAFDTLTDEEKTAYIDRAAAAVENQLIPAYQRLISKLQELKGSRSVADGLANYEGGKEYYEKLLRSEVGTERTPEELIQMTEDQINQDAVEIYMILMKKSSLQDQLDSYEFLYSDPEEILDYLAGNLGEDFPEPVTTSYTLKYVHEAMEKLESPAYYLIPAIDDWQKNSIYINRNPEYDSMDLFTTLSHEGFPGHLYQNTYERSLQLSPIRYLLGWNGYSEGWATYVELQYGYSLGLEDPALAKVLSANASFSEGIYTRVDLGIHYEGWDVNDVSTFLGSLGLQDKTLAQDLFDTIAPDPASYPAYYVGYLEFMNLRDLAEKAGVSTYDFHKFILEIGEMPFDLIEKRMIEYFDIQAEDSISTDEGAESGTSGDMNTESPEGTAAAA